MPTEESNEKSQNLTEKQLSAISLIIQGKNDSEVAREVGVTRETVNRWKNQDEHFEAELNRIERDMWNESKRKLRELSSKAIEILAKELEGEDKLKASIHVLKALGIYGSEGNRPYGRITPEGIRLERSLPYG